VDYIFISRASQSRHGLGTARARLTSKNYYTTVFASWSEAEIPLTGSKARVFLPFPGGDNNACPSMKFTPSPTPQQLSANAYLLSLPRETALRLPDEDKGLTTQL